MKGKVTIDLPPYEEIGKDDGFILYCRMNGCEFQATHSTFTKSERVKAYWDLLGHWKSEHKFELWVVEGAMKAKPEPPRAIS